MKHVTRIPVQSDSLTLQAANFFDALRQRGKLAALIVPDMYTAQMIRKALALSDKCVFAATEPGARWIRGRVFEVYVIANESLCADAVHRELTVQGQFIDLLASRQTTFDKAYIYAFTESRGRVTTDTQRKSPMFNNPTFKFQLKEPVNILISGEAGHVKARAQFVNSINQYQIHYRSADGRAVEGWFEETDLENERADAAYQGNLPN